MTWLLCVMLVAAPAKGGAKAAKSWAKDIKAAEHAFDRYEYDKAVKLFQAALAEVGGTDAQRQQARLLLSFAFFLGGHPADASKVLQELFFENPGFTIDRDATHPDLLKFFDEERAKAAKKPEPVAPEPAKTEPVKTEPVKTEPLPPVAAPTKETIVVAPVAPSTSQPVVETKQIAPAETVGDRHPWLRIFPGGIGHFVNHDFAAGGVFLGLEAACVATNIALGIVHNGTKTADGRFYRPGQDGFPLLVAMNVAGFAAITLAIIEIIDAFAASPARGRATLAPPTVTLGPLGEMRLVLGGI